MKIAESFNCSWFARFINSQAGRVLRSAVGIVLLVVGFLYREHALGVIAMVFSVLPLAAGVFDLCYVSALLGGPLSGAKIRQAKCRQPHVEAYGTR